MASYQPPVEELPIFDNSVFAVNLTGSLTVSQANLLYLRKTYPDTCTALETFQAGILTSSVNPLTSSSVLQLGASTNTGKVIISTINTSNTNANPAISIGVDAGTKTIKINNNTNSVHCSSLDFQTSSINNIVNDTGAISIGDKQTGGILNVGVGQTGIYRTQPINIGTGIYSAGASAFVNIGSTTCPIRTFGKTNLSYNSGTTVPSTISVVTGVTSVTNNIDFITGVGATAPALYDARIQAFSGNGDASNGSALLNLYSARQDFYDYTASLIGSMGRVISSSFSSMVANSGLTVNTLYTNNIESTVGGSMFVGNNNASVMTIMNGNSRATTMNVGSGGSNTTDIRLLGAVTLSKPLKLGTVASVNTELGYVFTTLSSKVTTINNGGAAVPIMTIITPSNGLWLCFFWVRLTSVLGASYNQIQTYIGGQFCGMCASGATSTVGASNNPFPTYSGSVVMSLNAGVTLGVEFFINIVSGIITLDSSSGMQMTRIG